MAADFSINQFSYIGRLLMVHGRDRYVMNTGSVCYFPTIFHSIVS